MSKIFVFLFNVIRNLSLFIVVCLIGIVVFLKYNENLAFKLADLVEDNHSDMLVSGTEYESFDMVSHEDPFITNSNSKVKKMKIPVNNGNAYLRASQVMYVLGGQNGLEIITTKEDSLVSKGTLRSLESILRKGDKNSFFKTKNAILNYNYIQQLISENDEYQNKNNYQYFVVMENNERIKISKDKHKELKNELNKITF